MTGAAWAGLCFRRNSKGKPCCGVPAADEGREEDGTEAGKMPKALFGDKQHGCSAAAMVRIAIWGALCVDNAPR